MQSTETPFARLLEDAFGNVQEIVPSEVRLAKAELREEAAKAGRAGAVLGGGIVIALFCVGVPALERGLWPLDSMARLARCAGVVYLK